MPDAVRDIGISVCAAAAAAALFRWLLPKSGIGKTGRFVAAIFFLCCFILPVSRLGPTAFSDFGFDGTDGKTGANPTFQEMVNRNLSELSQRTVARTARSLLAEEGITAKEIAVSTTIGEDNGIRINRIVIAVPGEEFEQAERAVSALVTGEETEICVIAEDETGS